MNLGDTIRILRSGKGLSQADLAAALNVSRQSVSKWETDSAVPDLDKLVSMSDLFGVTLDSLVRGTPTQAQTEAAGAAEPADGSPAPVNRTRQLAAVILLCFGALSALCLFFLGGGWSALLLAAPFLLCGAICLCVRKHTGLFCLWALFFCVDAYLRYATGITWQLILLTPRFTPEMNYIRLAVGWGQFLWGILLLVLTLRAYRSRWEPADRKHLLPAIAGLLLFAGISFAQQGILAHWHSLPAAQVNDAWYFWLRFLGDSAQLALLAALSVKAFALLRQWRADRRSGNGAA